MSKFEAGYSNSQRYVCAETNFILQASKPCIYISLRCIFVNTDK